MVKTKHNQIHTVQSSNSEFCISSLLPTGKENAISTVDLVRIAGCSSARELQQYIAQERKTGAVICSATTGGYFIPANHAEMAEFCRALENRAKNTFAVLGSVRRALKVPEGQQEIEMEKKEE